MEDNYDIDLITDFEELEYDLTSIGLLGLFLVFEYDIVYFYSSLSDFYYEVNNVFLKDILSNKSIIINDGEEEITFSVDQVDIIKNIFKEIIDAKYRHRLTKGIQE